MISDPASLTRNKSAKMIVNGRGKPFYILLAVSILFCMFMLPIDYSDVLFVGSTGKN